MNDNWGQGWDYLLRDIWDKLDELRDDNLEGKHNDRLIDSCFDFIHRLLIRDINGLISKTDWTTAEKVEVAEKADKIRGYFKDSKNINDKVIAINAAEQFLRAIY